MISVKTKLRGSFTKDLELARKRAVNVRLESIRSALQAATPVDTGEASKGWVVEGTQIKNEVEHIGYLNEGSSKQAPSHFIEKVILSHPGVTPAGTIVRPL